MKCKFYIIIATLLVASFQLKSQDYRLLLANETVEQQAAENQSELENQIKGLSSFNGFYYGLIQFKNLPKNSEIELLKSQGVELLDYMPGNAYYSKISMVHSISNYSNIINIAVI